MKLEWNPLKYADVFGILKPGGQFSKETTESLNSRGLGSFTHFHNDVAPWIAAAVASYGALSGGAAAGGGAASSGGLAGLGGAAAGPVQLSGPGYAGAGAAAGAGSGGAGASASAPSWLKYAKLANMAMNMGGSGQQQQYGGPPQHQYVGPENPYAAMVRRMYG